MLPVQLRIEFTQIEDILVADRQFAKELLYDMKQDDAAPKQQSQLQLREDPRPDTSGPLSKQAGSPAVSTAAPQREESHISGAQHGGGRVQEAELSARVPGTPANPAGPQTTSQPARRHSGEITPGLRPEWKRYPWKLFGQALGNPETYGMYRICLTADVLLLWGQHWMTMPSLTVNLCGVESNLMLMTPKIMNVCQV